MILNLSGVERLSSDMLGEMITLHKKLQGLGGRLALCCLKPKLTEVFEVLQLDQLFAIYPEEAAALASFE
jgi:anti-sigma B factor antagonist